MNSKQLISPLAILLLVVLLAACPFVPPPSIIPAEVAFNGYTVSRIEGSANFNLSALDANRDVILSGTVSNPVVSNLAVVGGAGAVTGTATICGQIIAQPSLVCAITLDATGSMRGNDPNRLRRDAAKAFVSRMATGDRAAVSSFDTRTAATPPYLAIHLWQDFTSDKNLLNAAIDRATFEGGGTPLWDAVYDSATLVKTQRGNRVALVLTDGANTDGRNTASTASSYASANGVKVYMVGLGDPRTLDFTGMQDVAAATGGLFAAASDPAGLQDLFDGVFRATRASFCIEVVFRVNGAIPPANTRITGTLNLQVDGRPFSTNFDVVF